MRVGSLEEGHDIHRGNWEIQSARIGTVGIGSRSASQRETVLHTRDGRQLCPQEAERRLALELGQLGGFPGFV